MTNIPVMIRAAVIMRARELCEYCRLAQVGQEAAFHIDHVIPTVAGGSTSEGNLALACVSCSLHKAAKLTAIDPESGEHAPLFNPRTQNWPEHFRWEGETAVGLSSSGRATVSALKMNRSLILAIRREEATRGRHPNH